MSKVDRPLDFVAIPLRLRAELWRHSTSDVGKALRLAMFCAEQLNGGVVKNARKWTAAEWRSYVNFSKPLEKTSEGLFTFVEDDLVVNIYNSDYEKRVLSKRKTNSNNIKNRWEKDTSVFPKDNSTEFKGSKDVVVVDSAESRAGDHPLDFDELLNFLKGHFHDTSGEQLEACANDFMRAGEESGWTDSAGTPIRSWKAAAVGYASKHIQRNQRPSRRRSERGERGERESLDPEREQARKEIEGLW